jgi:hypothetical protein
MPDVIGQNVARSYPQASAKLSTELSTEACTNSRVRTLDMLLRCQNLGVAYKIKTNNWEVVADTAQEVAQLLRILNGNGGPHSEEIEQRPDPRPWTLMRVALLEEAVREHPTQTSLLLTLAYQDNVESLYKEELAQQKGMSTPQLGGVLSGLAKNAKKLGTGPLFFVEKVQRNGKRTCRYRVDDNFKRFYRMATEQQFDEINHNETEESPAANVDDENIPF